MHVTRPSSITLCKKCPNTEFFQVRIIPYSDWTLKFTTFLYPLKMSENLWFSDVFRRYIKTLDLDRLQYSMETFLHMTTKNALELVPVLYPQQTSCLKHKQRNNPSWIQYYDSNINTLYYIRKAWEFALLKVEHDVGVQVREVGLFSGRSRHS